jgi:Ca2+-binding RTX toxin-like protein
MTLPGGATNATLSVAATTTETLTGATATTNGSIVLTIGSGGMAISGTSIADLLTGGTGADTFTGGLGADTISGAGGADLIIGGLGADLLTGGTGSDTFRYLGGDPVGGIDLITDFTAGASGDVIDIAALIPAYDENPLTLSNYVNLQESGGNTTIRIDPTGTANFTVSVATFQGVTGLDLATMRTNGNLVT